MLLNPDNVNTNVEAGFGGLGPSDAYFRAGRVPPLTFPGATLYLTAPAPDVAEGPFGH
jgi:hypothetical protein